jgi:hypothetical protein
VSLVGKPRPGVCGRCGHAVVRSVKAPREASDALQQEELNGHKYVAGRLVRVRCKDHGGLGWDDDLGQDDCFGGPTVVHAVYGRE